MAQYYISAQVKVDTSTVQTQLNAIKDKTINVKVNSTGTTEATKSLESIDTSAKSASKSILSLGGDFGTTMLKVSKFYVITQIIQGFTQSIGEAVTAVKDLDDAMIDYQKVSDLSGDALTQYTVKLGELGAEVARTRTEMVENATIFKQAGYSDDDAAMLSKVSSLYQNVADAEVSASDAGAFVVSQMKAWKLSANEAEGAVDQVNEV